MISTCEGFHKHWWGVPHGGDYYSLEQNIKGRDMRNHKEGKTLWILTFLD